MSTFAAQRLVARLDSGLAVLLDGSVAAAMARTGVEVDGLFGTADVLQHSTDALSEAHELACRAGAHIIRTNTAETTPQALQRAGYGYRAAKLTSRAVDVALVAVEQVGRVVAVAGVVPSIERAGGAMRDGPLREEQMAHAKRLVSAGCDVLYVSAVTTLREGVAGTAGAARTDAAVLVELEVDESGGLRDGEQLSHVLEALAVAGASGFIVSVPCARAALTVEHVLAAQSRPWGIVDSGDAPEPEAYAKRTAERHQRGAQLLCADAFVTEAHMHAVLAAVPEAVREMKRASMMPPSMSSMMPAPSGGSGR